MILALCSLRHIPNLCRHQKKLYLTRRRKTHYSLSFFGYFYKKLLIADGWGQGYIPYPHLSSLDITCKKKKKG